MTRIPGALSKAAGIYCLHCPIALAPGRYATAHASRKTADCHQHDAAGLPRLRRPVDPGYRSADDRPQPRRGAQSAVADHRFPDRRDGAYPALRQIRRHSRPSRRDADRHWLLYGRRPDLRLIAEHDDADLWPRRAGLRRRRTDRHRQHGPWRHRLTEGARQVLHLFFDRLHDRRRLRAGSRRVDFRSSALVGDLSVESPALCASDRARAHGAAPAAVPRPAAPARFRRRASCHGGKLVLHAGAQSRRRALSVAVFAGARAARLRGGAGGGLRHPAAHRGRAAYSDRHSVRSRRAALPSPRIRSAGARSSA